MLQYQQESSCPKRLIKDIRRNVPQSRRNLYPIPSSNRNNRRRSNRRSSHRSVDSAVDCTAFVPAVDSTAFVDAVEVAASALGSQLDYVAFALCVALRIDGTIVGIAGVFVALGTPSAGYGLVGGRLVGGRLGCREAWCI